MLYATQTVFIPLYSNFGGGGAGCFAIIILQMCCCCGYSVALPRGAVGWSAVCDCGIS